MILWPLREQELAHDKLREKVSHPILAGNFRNPYMNFIEHIASYRALEFKTEL